MAKKSSSAPAESENDHVADNAVVTDNAVASEEAGTVKKKAVRKRATKAGSAEAKSGKPVVKRTRRTKTDGAESSANAPVTKAFWGVFNQMMAQVAQFNYAEEDEAKKVAADLTEKKKAPHFVQLIKKVI